MKNFDTFEVVADMLECVKRPISVYCKQIPFIVHCKQINEDFTVNNKQGKAGDYLMQGIDKELYICDKAIFERSYDLIDPNTFAPMNISLRQD